MSQRLNSTSAIHIPVEDSVSGEHTILRYLQENHFQNEMNVLRSCKDRQPLITGEAKDRNQKLK